MTRVDKKMTDTQRPADMTTEDRHPHNLAAFTGDGGGPLAPFPYFGGKHRAAKLIWRALGDPGGYVEPFAGSAAVLLARPRFTGRRVETINDADGWLVNTWRAIQLSPDKVAAHAYGPVSEIDYHARLAWLQERRTDGLVSWLEGDPEAHDAKAAGWWLYVMACGIGDPFGPGPWRVVDGRLVNTRKLPHPGDPGQGVNRELPHLGDAGQGINRKLPHLGGPGKGINRALPHLGDAGRGINRKLPHLSDAGVGVNREFPHLGDDVREQLAAWMRALANRLARVRITCGDWTRVTTPAVLRATAGNPVTGVFLDPPYATSGDLYPATTDTSVAEQVRDWAVENGHKYRIVLCGYDDEHDALLAHGWTREAGKSGRGAGYSSNPLNGRRERLWLSPACIRDDDLFAHLEVTP